MLLNPVCSYKVKCLFEDLFIDEDCSSCVDKSKLKPIDKDVIVISARNDRAKKYTSKPVYRSREFYKVCVDMFMPSM